MQATEDLLGSHSTTSASYSLQALDHEVQARTSVKAAMMDVVTRHIRILCNGTAGLRAANSIENLLARVAHGFVLWARRPPLAKGLIGHAAQIAGHCPSGTEARQGVNPAIFAGEWTQGDAAEALREAESARRWRRGCSQLACRDTSDRRRGRLVCAPDRRPARAARSALQEY